MSKKSQLKVAAYYRVSLLLGQDTEHQRVPVHDYVRYKDFNLVAEYEDVGMSGGKDKRPGLDRLLADAKKGKFEVVVVAALDRLARDARMLLNLVHEWEKAGIYLVSLRENINFADDMGKTFLAILGAIGGLERATIRERIKTAMAVKKLSAQKLGAVWKCGRPKALTGDATQRIVELSLQGHSLRQIRTIIGGKVGVSTIQAALKEHQKATEVQV